jgi:hypothetical protein
VSLFGPAAFGVPSAGRDPAPLAATVAERRGDARLALLVLAVALAAIYAISAVTLAGRAPRTAAVLLAVAVLQAGWLASRRAARVGVALNVLLIAIWAVTRTRGQPIGLIDTLCAGDAAMVAGLAWLLGRSDGRLLRTFGPALSQGAIVLAAVSLAALAGGHTHVAQAAGPGPVRVQTHAFYCRLL